MIWVFELRCYEENQRLLAPLRAFLLLAGHTVSTCSKEGYPLAPFLRELVEELSQPYIPYYMSHPEFYG